MKASHLFTNEEEGSVQLSITSLSPPVVDLGTVAASPSLFRCIPLAPVFFFWLGFFFFETVLYISSPRNADRGVVSMETHFRQRRYLQMCCCICFSGCVSVRRH